MCVKDFVLNDKDKGNVRIKKNCHLVDASYKKPINYK